MRPGAGLSRQALFPDGEDLEGYLRLFFQVVNNPGNNPGWTAARNAQRDQPVEELMVAGLLGFLRRQPGNAAALALFQKLRIIV